MGELSYDQLIQELVEAKKSRDGATWTEAAIAYLLRTRMQVPAKQIASDTGYSGRYVSLLVKTFGSFPEESDRATDLTFSHHQIAAQTSEPSWWIDQACANGWSVRDMKKAIKGESDPDPVEEAQRVWDKILKLIEAGGPGAQYLVNQIHSY